MGDRRGAYRVLVRLLGRSRCRRESRRMNLAGDRWQVAGMGDRRGAYRVLIGRREGKRLLGRPRCRRECNITVDLQEV